MPPRPAADSAIARAEAIRQAGIDRAAAIEAAGEAEPPNCDSIVAGYEDAIRQAGRYARRGVAPGREQA